LKSVTRRQLAVPLVLAALVALLWGFPALWYTKTGDGRMQWLSERVDVPGWKYRAIPVDESAEKVLVADRMVSAEFTNSLGTSVQVFSAKRYDEKANEIGLFIHTPDRCWVEAGWRPEDVDRTFTEIELHGTRVPVERRIFDFKDHRELVYFFGLQDGRPLPYRLDHYLSTSHRFGATGDRRRELVRASDAHFWGRLWDSFTSRREVRGPKQFVRISTPLGLEEVAAADRRLENFLQEWLMQTDYNAEKTAWQLAAASRKDAKPDVH
jgi:hypothetical protein